MKRLHGSGVLLSALSGTGLEGPGSGTESVIEERIAGQGGTVTIAGTTYTLDAKGRLATGEDCDRSIHQLMSVMMVDQRDRALRKDWGQRVKATPEGEPKPPRIRVWDTDKDAGMLMDIMSKTNHFTRVKWYVVKGRNGAPDERKSVTATPAQVVQQLKGENPTANELRKAFASAI